MKTAKAICMLTVSVLFLGGCIVQSLNPYYTKESVCAVPGIQGEWRLLDEKGKPEPIKPWTFLNGKIQAFEKNGMAGTIKATYFTAGKSFFLDSIADEPGEGTNKWWTMHVFPVHLATKVETDGKRLTLTPMNHSWMEKAVKNKTVTIPYIWVKEENSALFTASSEEWMDFLTKNANNKDLFSDDNALHFIR